MNGRFGKRPYCFGNGISYEWIDFSFAATNPEASKRAGQLIVQQGDHLRVDATFRNLKETAVASAMDKRERLLVIAIVALCLFLGLLEVLYYYVHYH